MKYSKSTLLLLMAFFFFTSCNKKEPIKELENLEKTSKEETKGEWNNNKVDCFAFVYPISYTMPDASTVSGNTEEELDGAIKAWYETNPDSKEKPSLIYPVDIVWEDQSSGSINNEIEFKGAKERCDKDGGEKKDWEKCFDFVYPISYTMPDASTVSGASKEELGEAMKAWYEANPDSKEKPELVFPVDVIFEDGTVKNISKEEELKAVYEACKKDEKGWEECFDFVYPISYIMPDASTVSGNTKEELGQAMKVWYEANPDVEEKPALQFPVDIVFIEDNITLTVESEEDLKAVYERCK